jgi:hypothetical protein
MSEHESLGEALPAVMAYIRDTVIPAYENIGPTSIFAVSMMKYDLDLAAKAMAAGDLPGMISAYQALKDYKL